MSKKILTLEEIKQIELDILYYLHELCEKNDIKYFIDFGTLLGAIRHKGFIPWDDDTDISLARDEFEKLYNVLKKENHPHYKLISYRETKGYPYTYMRVYDVRTRRDANLLDNMMLSRLQILHVLLMTLTIQVELRKSGYMIQLKCHMRIFL